MVVATLHPSSALFLILLSLLPLDIQVPYLSRKIAVSAQANILCWKFHNTSQGVLFVKCFPWNLNGREIKGILQLLNEGET